MRKQFKTTGEKRSRAAQTLVRIHTQATAEDAIEQVMTDWGAAMAWFLQNARTQGQRSSSIEMRRQRFKDFATFAESHNLLPETVEPVNIRQFINHLQDLEQSNYTINGKLRVLKAFYNEAIADGLCEYNPADKIRRLREELNTVVPLTEKQIKALITSGFHLDDWVERRDYVVTLLILETGLRANEALQIKLDHLQIDESAILIPATNAKGGKARTVYMGSASMKALNEWLEVRDTPTDWLFPSVYIDASGNYAPLTRPAYYKRLKKYGERVGIDHIHPHQLRHTFAIQYLIHSGGDLVTASRQLGHSSVKVTERYMNVAATDAQKRLAQQHSLMDRMTTPEPKRTRGIATRKLGGK